MPSPACARLGIQQALTGSGIAARRSPDPVRLDGPV